jgi:DNA-binding MarR family transcriptional regulator
MQSLHDATISPASRLSGRPDDCARAVLDGLPSVMWFIRHHVRRHRTAGLSVPQFRALCLVDRCPTACLGALAEHLGSSGPSASRLVSGLVRKGFITRSTCDDDRRQIALVLTQRGRNALAVARQAAMEALAGELAQLDQRQRRNLLRAMNDLTEIFARPTNAD